ncbi:MAG: hypothetical protein ACTSXH_06590, partial [Promethearchaeota archaeon]
APTVLDSSFFTFTLSRYGSIAAYPNLPRENTGKIPRRPRFLGAEGGFFGCLVFDPLGRPRFCFGLEVKLVQVVMYLNCLFFRFLKKSACTPMVVVWRWLDLYSWCRIIALVHGISCG